MLLLFDEFFELGFPPRAIKPKCPKSNPNMTWDNLCVKDFFTPECPPEKLHGRAPNKTLLQFLVLAVSTALVVLVGELRHPYPFDDDFRVHICGGCFCSIRHSVLVLSTTIRTYGRMIFCIDDRLTL